MQASCKLALRSACLDNVFTLPHSSSSTKSVSECAPQQQGNRAGTAWEAYPDEEKGDEKVPGRAELPDGVRVVEVGR
eukprot:scaffold36241_cov18-Tisochrysis_lutea.AAC.4